jgi:alpha-L-fucosidase
VPDRELPAWFDESKFGIFVHWTPASVPAYAPVGPDPFTAAATHGWEHAMAHNPYVEWYQNSLAIDGSAVQRHHREHYGERPYDDFIPQFVEAHEGWRPDVWADLFASAGARYVVFVTKHHDGFVLWPSDTATRRPGWHARRDLVGELAAVVRERGLRFGVYYSGGLDWTFGGLPITDVASMLAAIPQSEEYTAYIDAHWRELIARYEPSLLWNDIGSPAGLDLAGLFTHFYERVPDGVVNNRFDVFGVAAGTVHADFVTPEYSLAADARGPKWEATRGMGTSFGFNRAETDDDYATARELVHLLVEAVARGGNLLLNVGPTADGSIPWVQATRLLAIGWWLERNGEAIYGTSPCDDPARTNRDGVQVRFTRHGDDRFAIVLDPPAKRQLHLPGEQPPADGMVSLLGYRGARPWAPAGTGPDDGIVVELPAPPPPSPALALRISPAL